jgi:hypothetical protein
LRMKRKRSRRFADDSVWRGSMLWSLLSSIWAKFRRFS